MVELLVYSLLLVAVLGHGWAAARWYKKNPSEHPAYLQPKECLEVKGLGFPRKSLVGGSIGTEELIF